ncbi:hypothetical protein ACNVED_05355 [Legionella sp. D16C41]|uniref:hypothetical protein n=2 Tax=Legionella TaxID=445 RepID=UPI003AF5B576
MQLDLRGNGMNFLDEIEFAVGNEYLSDYESIDSKLLSSITKEQLTNLLTQPHSNTICDITD